MKNRIVAGLLVTILLSVASLSFADGPRPSLFPNTKKYRDSGEKSAGRSGAATLAARALLGKDRTTELDVTTGQFESTTPPPGQITKIQVKAFATTGSQSYVRNYNHVDTGGLFVTALQDVVRGQLLQIQGNVRRVGGKGNAAVADNDNGTDVVTVTTPVQLRPDLRVVSLNAPTKVLVNSITNISAVIDEVNGDVGANADCALYVDNVRVDRSLNIWVDRNGTVTCAFAYNFPALGTKRLTVKVENVNPNDYDIANNSASLVISVVPIQILSASFYSVAYDNVNSEEINYTSNTNYSSYDAVVTSDSGYHDEYHSKYQWASVTSYTPVPINWNQATINVTEVSDGNAALSSTFSGLSALTCVSQYQSAADANLYACSTPGGSYINYNRWAGEATYYSESFTRYWYTEYWNNGFVFSYSSNYEIPVQGTLYQYGVLTPVGSQYGFDIKIQNGPVTYVASPRMTLQPTISTVGYPWTCSPLPASTAYTHPTGSSCQEHLQTNSQWWGYTSE